VSGAVLAVLLASVAIGCSPRLAPFDVEQPRIEGPRSVAADGLASLPPPQEKVVVAVYRFRDQTGQYRALENSSTFSTAVTQGATTILIGALEDSGWFVPIEREGLSNLLNERQIIQSTRQQYSGPEGAALPPLPPLLYAGILLEGGVIGYDSNVLTGGVGARYLGTGASGQFRQDQVTIYLRAVSTQNGRVLRTVHTTKTIVSQKLDGGVFRFVDTQRLLESEIGYSANEPPVLAVTAAIEEAVRALVVQGARDGLWQVAEPQSPEALAMFTDYDAQRDEDTRRDVYDRLPTPLPIGGFALHVAGGAARIEDDYAGTDAYPAGGLGLRYHVGPRIGIGVDVNSGAFQAGSEKGRLFVAGDLNVRYVAFPRFPLTPYAAAGVGLLNVPEAVDDRYLYGTVSAGLEARVHRSVGLTLGLRNVYPLRDGLDGRVGGGQIHDNLWSASAGLMFYGLGG
jgi:curli production assembly/transport component CsgG